MDAISTVRADRTGAAAASRRPASVIIVNPRVDRLLIAGAYGYLALPTLIFLLGWLRPYYAVPISAMLIFAVVMAIRRHSEGARSLTIDLRHLTAVIVLVLIWIALSGIGGLTFQNTDYNARNLVLHDLVACPWPLYLRDMGITQVYYHGFWLPAALIGKVAGLQAAHAALFLWTVIGVALAQYLLMRYFQRFSCWLALIFIGFSGMDIVGHLLLGRGWPDLTSHFERWNPYFQYSAVTTTLYWVFNQTVGVWVAIMLLLNQRVRACLGVIYSTLLVMAPFSAVGLAPMLVWWWWSMGRQHAHDAEPRPEARSVTAMWTVIIPVIIIAIFALYYGANPGSGGGSLIWELERGSLGYKVAMYLLLVALEFGVLALLIGHAFRREPLFWIALVCLLLIPNYHSVRNNDFAMRVSIPSLLLLMIFAGRYLYDLTAVPTSRVTRWAVIAVLVIGGCTPLTEMGRSLAVGERWPVVADKYATFDPANAGKALLPFAYDAPITLVYHPERTIFFRWLARQ